MTSHPVCARTIAGLAIVCLPVCLWDYDTILMERKRFPDALELITGKFLRHGEAFYRWRVEDRTARIAQTPDALALYDDLAVAWDKLGEGERAVATILEKRAREATPSYETLANHGTFLVHLGRHEEGLAQIRAAIARNPQAHFGREIYQAWLVEYVQSRTTEDGLALPLRRDGRGFQVFLRERGAIGEREAADADVEAAVRGVLGMMRFGRHDAPVLLEALGDLLRWPTRRGDAKRLAARAYLRASYVTEGETRAAYRGLAAEALRMQTVHPRTETELTLAELERTFAEELAEADAWFARVEERERSWIRAGGDVDEAFRRAYFEAPEVEASGEPGTRTPWLPWLALLLAAPALVLLGRRVLQRFAGLPRG